MKKIELFKRYFLTCIFICLTPLAHANSPADDLSQLLNNIHSLQADFTQTIIDGKHRLIQKSQGRMALQRPGKFRWDVTKPNPQLIVANGKRLWIYDPDLEQVTIRTLTKAAGEAPALLLSNTNTALENDFVVRAVSGEQAFILLPRDKSSMLVQIKLGFVNNQIRIMQLQDHLGQTTLIQFQRVRNDVVLSPGLFTFQPPSHVDVIDETKQKKKG